MGASCSSTVTGDDDDTHDDFKCADVAAHDDRQPPPRPSIAVSDRQPRSDSPHLTASRSISRSRSFSRGADGRKRLHKQGPPPAGTGYPSHPLPKQRRRSRSVASDGNTPRFNHSRKARCSSRSGESVSSASSQVSNVKSIYASPPQPHPPLRRGRSVSTSYTDSVEIRHNHLYAAFPDSAIPPRPSNPHSHNKRAVDDVSRRPSPPPIQHLANSSNSTLSLFGDQQYRTSPSKSVTRIQEVPSGPRVYDVSPSLHVSGRTETLGDIRSAYTESSSENGRSPSLARQREAPRLHDQGPSFRPSPSLQTLSRSSSVRAPLSPATPESPTQPDLASRALPSRPRKKSSPSKPANLPSIATIVASPSPPPAARTTSSSNHSLSASVSQATAAALTASPPFPAPVRPLPGTPAWPLAVGSTKAPGAGRQRPMPLPLGTAKSYTTDALPTPLSRESASNRYSIRSSTSSIYTDSGPDFSPQTPGPQLSSFPSISAFPHPGGFGMQTGPASWDRHAATTRKAHQAEDMDPDAAYGVPQFSTADSLMVRGLETPPATKTGFGLTPWDRQAEMSVPIVLESSPTRGMGAGVVDDRLRQMGMAMLRSATTGRDEAWM